MRHMDPRDYRFVQDGPSCVCSHQRINHVAPSSDWFDGECEIPECGCDSYWPAGDVDYTTMRETEFVEEQQVHELRAQSAHRRAMWLWLMIGGLIGWMAPVFGAGWFMAVWVTLASAAVFAWWLLA